MNRYLKMLVGAVAVIAVFGIGAYAYAASRTESKMIGVVVTAGNASLEVANQPGAGSTLVVDRVQAPGDSWVVVHLDMDGKPGKRVGLARVAAGESGEILVALDPAIPLTDKVLVALHADRGVVGTFEFDMEKFETSPDKPYFVDGMELATAVGVR